MWKASRLRSIRGNSKMRKRALKWRVARRADRGIRAGGRAETPRAGSHFRSQSARRRVQAWIAARGRTAAALRHILRARRTSARGESRPLGLARLAGSNIAIPAVPPSSSSPREHEREILFHGWLQWKVDRQIAGVQQHAREPGMSIGLYHDLALATDRCGSDLWAHRKFFVAGLPGGLAAGRFFAHRPGLVVSAARLRAASRRRLPSVRGIDPQVDAARRGAAHRSCDAAFPALLDSRRATTRAHGAYVRDRANDLVRILALESVRNQRRHRRRRSRHGRARSARDAGAVRHSELPAAVFRARLTARIQAARSSIRRRRSPPPPRTIWPPSPDSGRRRHRGPAARRNHRPRGLRSQQADRARDKQHLLDALFAAGADAGRLTGAERDR